VRCAAAARCDAGYYYVRGGGGCSAAARAGGGGPAARGAPLLRCCCPSHTFPAAYRPMESTSLLLLRLLLPPLLLLLGTPAAGGRRRGSPINLLLPDGQTSSSSSSSASSSLLPSLKGMMPNGMHIGAAMHYDSVMASKHADAAQYAALQASQFSMSQDKNCMNWAFVEYKERGVFRWGPADSFVEWCHTHGPTLVRGHALAWGAHLPAWLLAMAPENGTVGNASTVAAIRHAVNESIAAMVGRYRGRVYAWHAVMEAFGDPHWKQPQWKDNLLYRTFGEGYVGMIFDFAHAADPAAKLCLLDYQISWGMYAGGVWDHAKADMFFSIVSGFKKVSSWASNLDCVCMETHLQPTVVANQSGYTWLRRNFDRYATIGVEVHLNALTISIDGFDNGWSNAQKFEAQATWYHVFLQACVDSPACVDFEPYGLTDKYDMGTEPIYSLPFDTNYAPKPAYFAMVSVLNRSIPRQSSK
jgi:endo-1,4-beta-xylanase